MLVKRYNAVAFVTDHVPGIFPGNFQGNSACRGGPGLARGWQVAGVPRLCAVYRMSAEMLSAMSGLIVVK